MKYAMLVCSIACSEFNRPNDQAKSETIKSGTAQVGALVDVAKSASPADALKGGVEGAIPEVVKTDSPQAPTKQTGPAGCPSWSDLRACQHEGFVYAAAKASSDSRLGEATAMQRARAGIGSDLDRSEIPAVAQCSDGVAALARAPVAVGGSAVAACSTPLLAPPPATGCPEWTTKRAYRDGETLYVVAVVDPKLPLPLAQTAAENTARAEAVAYFHWSSKDGVAKVAGAVPAQRGQERVDCGGKTYVRLSYSAR